MVRPAIGPAVNIRLPADLLADLDAWAAENNLSRAEAVRRILANVLELT